MTANTVYERVSVSLFRPLYHGVTVLQTLTKVSCSFLVLLRFDGKAVDVEKCADRGDHLPCPISIYRQSEHKVGDQVCMLEFRRDRLKAKSLGIGEKCTTDKRQKHDGPVRERLSCEVIQDYLGSESTKGQRHCQTEKYKVIVPQQMTCR